MFQIFKTNVKNAMQANALLVVLSRYLPSTEINFDLEDCDHILRVKGGRFCSLNIIRILTERGFECHVLE